MILADTSIWIDHFRQPNAALADLIRESGLLMHPFVVGELAVGSIGNRDAIMRQFARLPSLLPARHPEVLTLIETHKLYGIGIGWTDAHLLCAVRLRPDCSLWTRDKRLDAAAQRLGIAAA